MPAHHGSWVHRRLGRRPLLLAGSAALAMACDRGKIGQSNRISSVPMTPVLNTGAASTESAQRGGTFRSTNTSPVGIQDPHFGPANGWATSYMGDPLIEIGNASRKLAPGVIEHWEQPDKDILVLRVRPGVKFFNMPPANGRDVEARDIVYMIKSMTGAQYPDAKIPFPRRNLFDGLADVTAVDMRTVRLTFDRPRSDILLSLAERRTAVVPEGLREYFGGIESLYGLRAERMVGTGPFLPDRLDPEGEMRWKRNPEYWHLPYPYVDFVQINVVNDPSAWATALISGQNHYMTSVQQQTIDLVKRGLPEVQVFRYAPGGYWYHLGLNNRLKPFNDPRVRRAIALLVDKPALSQTIFGHSTPPLWRYPGTLPWTYPESLPQDDLAKQPGMRSPTPEDIAEAKRLAAAAGYKDGVSFTITAAVEQLGTHQYKLIAEHVKGQVEKHLPGSRVAIDASNYTAMLAKIGNPSSDFNVYTGGWAHELSPILMLAISYHSKGGRNFTGYSDPRMDSYIDAAYAEFDEQKRTAILRDAQRLALEQWSHIPTHHAEFQALVHPTVRNLDLGSVGEPTSYIRYAWLTKTP